MELVPTVVYAAHDEVGEGPVWCAGQAALYWVDIYRHLVQRLHLPSMRHDSCDVGVRVSALGLRCDGGLILATKGGFAFWSEQTPMLEWLGHPEAAHPTQRFNDGAVDAQGRFWAGTMSDDPTTTAAVGSLYRYDPDGTIHHMDDDFLLTNGLGWSPDGRTMYVTDTGRQTIFAYDCAPASGTLSQRRPFITIPKELGAPDGLAIDQAGGIWSACWGGGRLLRYDATGRVTDEIHLPTAYPTSCTFGGPDLATLFITSARTALSPDELVRQPEAGAVFSLHVEIAGLPQPCFAG